MADTHMPKSAKRALQEKSAMKRHLAWWIVFGLLALAWAPFGLDELSRPMNHGHAAKFEMHRSLVESHSRCE